MKKFLSYATAAILTVGIIGASVQTADAGRRHDNRVAGALALGLIGGALIGGAIAWDRYDSRPRYRYYDRPVRHYRHRRAARGVGLRARHVRWCRNTYRSYRRWDNSFQPYEGRRRACLSPFN